VLASGNAGKLAELNAMTASLGWQFESQASLGVGEAAEPFSTFLENALTKARHASAATGLPALADDSGLCLSALGDAPGVRSARWAQLQGCTELIQTLGQDGANNEVVARAMRGQSDRRAKFVSVVVFVQHAHDPVPIVAYGEWRGEYLEQARGTGGFGYDPYFFVPDLGLSAAQMPAAQKNQISHRANAMKNLLVQLHAL
jgi:XTP/dITP diphosphohydrolase